jgi:hypothetical protein
VKHQSIRRQRPLKGGRTYAFVALNPETADLVEATMRRFHVARSFVLSVMADEVADNEARETFLPMPKSGRRPRLSDALHQPRLHLVKRRA